MFLQAPAARLVERRFGFLVAHQFQRAEKADSSRMADQRMIGKSAERGLKPAGQVSHVLENLPLLEQFQCLEGNRATDRVAGMRETMAERADLCRLRRDCIRYFGRDDQARHREV